MYSCFQLILLPFVTSQLNSFRIPFPKAVVTPYRKARTDSQRMKIKFYMTKFYPLGILWCTDQIERMCNTFLTDTHRICNKLEREMFLTERTPNINPTDEHCIKQTHNKSIPDKTNVQDKQKIKGSNNKTCKSHTPDLNSYQKWFKCFHLTGFS